MKVKIMLLLLVILAVPTASSQNSVIEYFDIGFS